jgi:hypothetical protein
MLNTEKRKKNCNRGKYLADRDPLVKGTVPKDGYFLLSFYLLLTNYLLILKMLT